MSKKLKKRVESHMAGATVMHSGPFTDLEVPVSSRQPDMVLFHKFVKPFYSQSLILNHQRHTHG